MLVCLSSGASPRYRQDILRALAMPQGASLPFRYQSKWIAPRILEKIQAGKIKDSAAIIAYIDQTDPNKAPELVPCRLASVAEAEIVGTSVSLMLDLKEFAFAEDLTAFNTEVQTQSAGTLPAWQADGKLKGHYWFEANPGLSTIIQSQKLADWERVVNQLVSHKEFVDESGFYTIQGIYPVGSQVAIQSLKGSYQFAAGREFEVRIYHFYPKSGALTARLTLATSSPWLTFVTNPLLMLDSRYDLKRVRIKAGKASTREPAILSILRGTAIVGSADLEFDLLVTILSNFWSTLGYGLVLGVLLAGPQIVAAFSNPTLPKKNACLISGVSGIVGLATGIFAAFGLKRNP